MYQIIPHTADVGLRINATNLNSLFEDAGRGFFSLIVANIDTVRPSMSQEFKIAGDNAEYLLFDWLSELLFTFETEGMVFSEFQVSVDEGGLEGVAYGEKLDVNRHHLEHEVKAITYHGLRVACGDSGCSAEVIVDI